MVSESRHKSQVVASEQKSIEIEHLHSNIVRETTTEENFPNIQHVAAKRMNGEKVEPTPS